MSPQQYPSAIVLSIVLVFAALSLAADTIPWTWGTVPTDADALTLQKTVEKGDVAAAEQQIQGWLDQHHVLWTMWYYAFPAMVKVHHEQAIADMTIEGLNCNPWPEDAQTLLEWRIRAFLLMNQPQRALAAAKSYYNLCPMKKTPRAVELVALCLAQANPADPQIAVRFRHEQAVASQIGIGAANAPSAQPAPSAEPAQPAILKSVTVDAGEYADGLAQWGSSRTFDFQHNQANLLLAADRPAEAEAIFRDLLTRSRTQGQIDAAWEGIAESLRAEDGNLSRANAFLAGRGE